MISLDGIKACSNPKCRLLLPADPYDEPNAGFWVAKREGGAGSRVLRYQSWCRDCQRARIRIAGGIRARGRPYEERVPLTPAQRGARTRKRKRHLLELQAQHAERMRTDPRYRRAYRRREVERKRVARRRAGIAPRHPELRREGLPAAPLIAFLREATAERGAKTAIARAAGVSYDRIHILSRGYYWHKVPSTGKMRRYEIRRVTLPVAERIVEAAGGTLDDIWPDGLV